MQKAGALPHLPLSVSLCFPIHLGEDNFVSYLCQANIIVNVDWSICVGYDSSGEQLGILFGRS